MNATEAQTFTRTSDAHATILEMEAASRSCSCEAYVDWFTYRRWQAQGFQVQKGEKAIRLPLIYQRSEKDPETGEETVSRRMGRSAVFCRCQVRPINGGAK